MTNIRKPFFVVSSKKFLITEFIEIILAKNSLSPIGIDLKLLANKSIEVFLDWGMVVIHR
ncbi:MAG: hypothetical protein N2260_05215 [Syntrophobacterales bacterium]|nr:hypothetical protein [Syntrophobacterales bacterium]